MNLQRDARLRDVQHPHLRLRQELMDALRDLIQDRDLRQRDAAVLFGVTQPRVSDLVRGKIALFSIDTLVDMLAAAGVAVDIQLRQPRSADRRTSDRTPDRGSDRSLPSRPRRGRA